MGEPINTQPIAPKEKEANLLSSAVPDSLGTEREGGGGGEKGEKEVEREEERGRGKEREGESTISAQSAAVSFCFFILTANKKTMPTVFLHTKLAIN